ncbi:MAG: hypothetical protein K2H36_00730, partial [Clostridia bacterium]|nr:hypothetical protein [Clostridia bacterium]
MPYKRTEAISDQQQVKDLGNLLVDNYEEKEKIFDGNQLSKLYSALLSEDGATYADVKSATSGTNGVKTSDDFRSEYNEGKDLIVKIGDWAWNVMYLSNTKADGTGDPIVTLWLTHSAQLPEEYRTAQWSTYNSNVSSQPAYPANMYGTSYMRAVALNNGGKYATSSSELLETEVEQSYDNPFAMFTMPNTSTYKSSLINYITMPSEVEWQEKETSSTTTGGANSYAYNFNNDSYSMSSQGAMRSGIDYTNPPSNVTDRETTYSAWKNDKIWLPSMAEVGWTSSLRGLWHTNANQKGNDNGADTTHALTWLRSACTSNYYQIEALKANGSGDNNSSYQNQFAVRPAFHLNLAKAEETSTAPTPQTKGDTKKYYNDGNDLTFELDKIIASKVDITL